MKSDREKKIKEKITTIHYYDENTNSIMYIINTTTH